MMQNGTSTESDIKVYHGLNTKRHILVIYIIHCFPQTGYFFLQLVHNVTKATPPSGTHSGLHGLAPGMQSLGWNSLVGQSPTRYYPEYYYLISSGFRIMICK